MVASLAHPYETRPCTNCRSSYCSRSIRRRQCTAVELGIDRRNDHHLRATAPRRRARLGRDRWSRGGRRRRARRRILSPGSSPCRHLSRCGITDRLRPSRAAGHGGRGSDGTTELRDALLSRAAHGGHDHSVAPSGEDPRRSGVGERRDRRGSRGAAGADDHGQRANVAGRGRRAGRPRAIGHRSARLQQRLLRPDAHAHRQPVRIGAVAACQRALPLHRVERRHRAHRGAARSRRCPCMAPTARTACCTSSRRCSPTSATLATTTAPT